MGACLLPILLGLPATMGTYTWWKADSQVQLLVSFSFGCKLIKQWDSVRASYVVWLVPWCSCQRHRELQAGTCGRTAEGLTTCQDMCSVRSYRVDRNVSTVAYRAVAWVALGGRSLSKWCKWYCDVRFQGCGLQILMDFFAAWLPGCDYGI